MRSALDAPAIMDVNLNQPLSYTRSVKSFRDINNNSKMAMGDGISGTSLTTGLQVMNSARRPPVPVKAAHLEARSSKLLKKYSMVICHKECLSDVNKQLAE